MPALLIEVNMAITREQKAQIQRQLLRRERALHADIDRETGKRVPHRELAGEIGDAGDASAATLIADLNDAGVGRDVAELRAIARARQSLREDEYGHCLDCGTDIPFERLRAQPTALRCGRCQALSERTAAHPQPSPTL
jgi:DnaK suppressor protein